MFYVATILSNIDLTLPLTNPVLKFFLILVIILFTPILLNKFKIPYLLGLIIAGAVIGPNGFNLMLRDSSIILSGTAGLLYIMFLAGLEIDMADFKKNASKSTVLGIYGFIIPMVLGTLAGIYLLNFTLITSVLLASMFSSHTLISYPIVSKFGIVKNRAVNITVGSTMITNVLALLVLAIIVGLSSGAVNHFFWVKLSVSLILFGLVVMFLFPIIGRWFLKRYEDSVSQYIFILAMVFLGSVLAMISGIEAIIGAFLAGLALNRLVPKTSALMNRINFVGNAIFIPFFLIGVGMLIDYKAFISDIETIKVAIVMSGIATLGKFSASWLTQKQYRFSKDERRIIFGLSNAQAAATLAAVLVGYNIITGYSDNGEPIRLLNENILNGTIVMILITCTISSFVTQKGAQNIALSETSDPSSEREMREKILIPVNNPETLTELISLSVIIKSKKNSTGLFALNIINNTSHEPDAGRKAEKLLENAVITASASDNNLNKLLRYDHNIINGITSVIKENQITDLVLGLHEKKNITETFLGELTEGILNKCHTTTLVYKPSQPLATIKRHHVIVPLRAEREAGFPFWLVKVWNIARNAGARVVFYAPQHTLNMIREINLKHPIQASFVNFVDWDDFSKISKDIKKDDNLIMILSRRNKISYHSKMEKVPIYINQYFRQNSIILVYPLQTGLSEVPVPDYHDSSLAESIEKLDEIGKTISRLFKKRDK
jgi:Kef-type K+ transport system membrane component KefB/nucleotide-binding universal stress UspA family protein